MPGQLSLWSSVRNWRALLTHRALSDCCGRTSEGSTERAPFLWEDGTPTAGKPKVKSVAEALRVISLVLQSDRLADGQRVDLTYVRAVLNSLVDDDRERRDVSAIMNNEELDGPTMEWLLAFSTRVERRHKLKDVVNAVRMGIRMRHQTSQNSSPAPVSLNEGELASLDSWSDFNIFNVASNTARPLVAVAWAVLERRGLIEAFHLARPRLHRYLEELERSYLNNPYHNATHAADVTQSSHVLLRRGLERSLSDLEILAVILAAACHDVGHPGVTNDFRVKSEDADAITYNDRSVNENMHLAIAYRLLHKQECDFVHHSFTPKQRESLRKMIIDMVLATDMAQHFANLSILQAMTEEKGVDVGSWENTTPALEACLHGADLSSTAKPHAVALRWTDLVLDEFFNQGDQERRLGRELSPLCDRHTVSKAGAQTGFINFIVKPMYQALQPLCDTAEMLENLQAYHSFWSEELAEEKKRRHSHSRQTTQVRLRTVRRSFGGESM